MSYNPTIAAARRAAKQIARETGEPYQATLDTVARQAGRADWNEYLGAPVTLPATAGDGGLYVDGEEHAANIRNMWIAGIGGMPGLLVLPHTFDRSVASMLPTVALACTLWLFGLMMATMFMSMLAVHPDVPEIGRDGRRERYTATDLAWLGIMLTGLALVPAILTRDQPASELPNVITAAIVALACGGGTLAISRWSGPRIAARILAIVSMNGAVAASFLAIASMGRH